MAVIELTVKQIMNLGLWDKVCEYKGWEPYILSEGRIDEDELVMFDDTFEKDYDKQEENELRYAVSVIENKLNKIKNLTKAEIKEWSIDDRQEIMEEIREIRDGDMYKLLDSLNSFLYSG